MNCDHYIGMWLDYEDTDLVTEEDLRLLVKHKHVCIFGKFQIEDYFDMRKSTNLIRFKYCPNCGEKLDWRKMKHEN